MSTSQTNREAWRKFLGIKDPSSALASGRVGGEIGRTAGRAGGSGGGGAIDSDSIPEGDGESSAEKGDGAVDGGEQLRQGDDADRIEDLYDCETGEKITIDGLGKNGTERYPTGFEDCKKSETPADYFEGYYFEASGKLINGATSTVITENPPQVFQRLSQAASYATAFAAGYPWAEGGAWASVSQQGGDAGEVCFKDGVPYNWQGKTIKTSCAVKYNAICNLPPPKPSWPAPDKNHLTWNKEKGCFEPLCPELNNQVLDKYKSCEEERILCDKDGNKVKVTVDGDTVKVTQAKYNQTAEIKDGKVQTVKKLSESQTEAEFK